MPKRVELTREEFEIIIKNYKAAGRDTTELEAALAETYPERKAEVGMDEGIAKLRDASPISNGECPLCGATGELISGVCQECFELWATTIIKARQKRGQRI